MRSNRFSFALFAPALLLALALLPLRPASADAQLRIGGHAAFAPDAFGGAWGAGLRGVLTLPGVPVGGSASFDYFFPDCPAVQDDCALRGAEVALHLIPLPMAPVVRPYLAGGFAWRRFAPGGGVAAQDTSGFTAGAGIELRAIRVAAFAEARWEFVEAPEEQWIARAGIALPLF